jgi:predicted ATPase
VTLTGPGGVGKTRLAVAVGERVRERFDAGTLFVGLEGVTQPDLVLAAIGRAMGADLTGIDAPVEALVEQLGDGRWLLILDNLEQVLEVARDLDQLLVRCPGLAILATSLTALRLRAEREYPVTPLSPPADPAGATVEELGSSPGVALFLDRARAVRPDFTLTEGNAAAVVEICRRLEGLPLAIELAAARTRLLDPQALLRRLERSLDALGSGTVDMPARQQTLRATVDWSIGMLNDAERSLLETVAVFVDGWTVEAAADVAGLDEDRALDLTEALARHSLIRLDEGEGGLRPRMLQTIRAFVAERLGARPDAVEIGRRHAEHYRALAEQADRPLRGLGQGAWFRRLQAEAGNLGAAVRWYLDHDTEPLPSIFRVLWPFWFLGDHMDESRAWVAGLLPAAASLNPWARAKLEWTALVVALDVGDDEAALAARARLEPLLQEVQDPFLHALSHLAGAWTSPIVGDFDDAIRSASAALDALRGMDEPFWTAMTVGSLGYLEMSTGREGDALEHLIETGDLAGRFDHTWLAAWSRTLLGDLATMRGRPDEARPLLLEALDLSVAARSTASVTLCLVAFARLFLVEGEPERAALALGAAEGLRGRVGLRAWPTLRRPQAELTARVREALGDDRFDERFAAGARLSQRAAVAAVLETVEGDAAA